MIALSNKKTALLYKRIANAKREVVRVSKMAVVKPIGRPAAEKKRTTAKGKTRAEGQL